MVLQRTAHEELGLGTWTHGVSSIPTTKNDVFLGTLDLTDEKHPRLQRPKLGINFNTYLLSEDTLNAESRGGSDAEKDVSKALESGAYLDCSSLYLGTTGGRTSRSITDEEL
ncbi:hypothetical protein F4776DRAFT_665257 [Hypoxylon sp. NC0597]|nr:hypothetical protein F4776DRAFT_665257 [Hypoxylon sp. NC0597]